LQLLPDGGTSSCPASSTPIVKHSAVDVISGDGATGQSRARQAHKTASFRRFVSERPRNPNACDNCKAGSYWSVARLVFAMHLSHGWPIHRSFASLLLTSWLYNSVERFDAKLFNGTMPATNPANAAPNSISLAK
jgi:hypothetical protein